jgi:DNA polymerase family B
MEINRTNILSEFTPNNYIKYTNNELRAEKEAKFVFDIECFSEYFLICFKNIENNKIVTISKTKTIELDVKKIRHMIDNYFLIGFNSWNYDLVMLSAALYGKSLEELKNISNLIIKDTPLRAIEDTFEFKRLIFNQHIDICEIVPNHPSLKLLGARLNAKRIQDLPFEPDKVLTPEEQLIVKNYCINDLDITQLLYNSLLPQIELRKKLSEKYKINLHSKSDSQIAEAVLSNELEKTIGDKLSPTQIDPISIFKYNAPSYLQFKNQDFNEFLNKCISTDFTLDTKGHIINEKLKELIINSKYRLYTVGLGGLHSRETKQALISDSEYSVIDLDCASFYPSIILNLGLYPESVGKNFIDVYRNIVNTRLEAKKNKDKITSEGLKITINASFGKFGCQHSILYSPQLMLQVTLTGQLSLLMLIDRLEQINIKVVSANTDGILVRVSKIEEIKMLEVLNQWEKDINFVIEQTKYKSIYSANINSYIAIKEDDSYKCKGMFNNPVEKTLIKNASNTVITKAILELIINNIPIKTTIENETDITQFLTIKKVKDGAHQNGNFLGKIVRWYKVKNTLNTINYISNNHIVAGSEGSKPLIELGDFPRDLDYNWYINETNKMLWEIGYFKEQMLFNLSDY